MDWKRNRDKEKEPDKNMDRETAMKKQDAILFDILFDGKTPPISAGTPTPTTPTDTTEGSTPTLNTNTTQVSTPTLTDIE